MSLTPHVKKVSKHINFNTLLTCILIGVVKYEGEKIAKYIQKVEEHDNRLNVHEQRLNEHDRRLDNHEIRIMRHEDGRSLK